MKTIKDLYLDTLESMNYKYKETIMSSFRCKQLLEISATTMMQIGNNV